MSVTFKAVSKTYSIGSRPVCALTGLTLSIEPGEFVAIMGPSGSGKSTLLNILGCLHRPSSGEYLLDGQRVDSLSESELSKIRNKKIGFVFQSFNLLPRLTALENVELPLVYAGHERKARKAASREILARLGLAERLVHRPSELSGGQQQRVAIARALVNKPSILLADEATGNLDSKSAMEIVGLLSELNLKGLTVVMVTHEREVAQYAKRLIVVRDGALVSDGQTAR